jgi:hypothetical protein
MFSIALDKNMKAYVSLLIKPFDRLILDYVTFKVDTGSDFTTISWESLEFLGYSKKWVRANTIKAIPSRLADGTEIVSRLITIGIINFGGFDIKDARILAPQEDLDLKNLFGLNLLYGFRTVYDTKAWECSFEQVIPGRHWDEEVSGGHSVSKLGLF